MNFKFIKENDDEQKSQNKESSTLKNIGTVAGIGAAGYGLGRTYKLGGEKLDTLAKSIMDKQNKLAQLNKSNATSEVKDKLRGEIDATQKEYVDMNDNTLGNFGVGVNSLVNTSKDFIRDKWTSGVDTVYQSPVTSGAIGGSAIGAAYLAKKAYDDYKTKKEQSNTTQTLSNINQQTVNPNTNTTNT
jgi:hypothetical protein